MRKFKSRKFLVALSSAILIVLNEGLGFGIDPSAYSYIVTIAIGYIVSQGVVDVVEQSNK